MQFFTGISGNTKSKSYMLSSTDCVWDFQKMHSGTLINMPYCHKNNEEEQWDWNIKFYWVLISFSFASAETYGLLWPQAPRHFQREYLDRHWRKILNLKPEAAQGNPVRSSLTFIPSDVNCVLSCYILKYFPCLNL